MMALQRTRNEGNPTSAHHTELLAPAGGEEQLDYAIHFGADAVYLATERYGMRARSANFAIEDLPRIVEKAHNHHVAVHVTCNTMMHDEDIMQLPSFLEQVDDADVDALIIGDLGAASLAQKHAPHTQIHVSTQASVCNAETAKVWHQLGATRIVAAREVSLADLALMKSHMPQGMELEAFAHGAMCMAYSGRCLISDFLTEGERSGIYGNCAQSCRWQYALMEEWRPGEYYPIEEDGKSSYILNAEDICMIEHLDAMANAGINSIKIEGRNKKAYYVACVVNAYRQVLDGADPREFLRELDCVSHRPYSTGFYFGRGRQTSDNLVYVRNTDWAGQVLGCTKQRDGAYRIEFRCRSHFKLTDAFELLSPRKPVQAVHLQNLEYVPGSLFETRPSEQPEGWDPSSMEHETTDQANHPSCRYFATSDLPMAEGDIIRVIR